MPSAIGSFIKKKLLGKNQNLVSLDDHYNAMQRLLKGHRITGVIDAGAGYGRISKRILAKFPDAHSYAFEPNPVFRQVLQEYAIKDPRFHPFFDALSDFEGTADFYFTKATGNSSLFAPAERLSEISPRGSAIEHKDKVNVATIDNWARRNGDIPIQLMKFDIQGGELKALQGGIGMLRTSVLLVYTEILFSPAYEGGAIFGDIDSFLRQNGFELYDIFKPHYDKHGRFTWANAIYINSEKIPTKRIA
jgi:FkbM family methyltransferase